MRDCIKTAISTNGKYRIEVYVDGLPSAPCVAWDNVGLYLFEYSDSHRLHSQCNWKDLFGDSHHSLVEALNFLAIRHCSEALYKSGLNGESSVSSLVALINENAEDIVVWETTMVGYSQGDYLKMVGYCTKDRFEDIYGTDQNWKSVALCEMKDDAKNINKWMWGDVYKYVLQEKVEFTKTYRDGRIEEGFEWKAIDACGDVFEDVDEIIDNYLPQE